MRSLPKFVSILVLAAALVLGGAAIGIAVISLSQREEAPPSPLGAETESASSRASMERQAGPASMLGANKKSSELQEQPDGEASKDPRKEASRTIVSSERRIRGRVIDEKGTGLSGWFIKAGVFPQDGANQGSAESVSGAKGAFSIECWRADRYWLGAIDPAGPPLIRAVINDVHVGSTDVVLTVPNVDFSTGSLHGQLRHSRGGIPRGPRIAIEDPQGVRVPVEVDAWGRFGVAKLPPQKYFLMIACEEVPEFERGPFLVVEREDLDVGEVVVRELGHLIVHLRGTGEASPPGEHSPIGFVANRGIRSVRHTSLKMGPAGDAMLKLAPGHYVIMVGGFGHWAQVRHEVDISESETKHLDIQLIPGAARLIRLPAGNHGKIERFDLLMKDAAGRVIFDSTETGTRIDSESKIHFVLPFERIELVATMWKTARIFVSSLDGKNLPPDQEKTFLEWRE